MTERIYPLFNERAKRQLLLVVCAATVLIVLSGCYESGVQYRMSYRQSGLDAASPYLKDREAYRKSAEAESTEEAKSLQEQIVEVEQNLEAVKPDEKISFSNVWELLIKDTETSEMTLNIQAPAYDSPAGKELGPLNCKAIEHCQDYMLDIAQQNIAVLQTEQADGHTWAKVAPSTWVKVAPPLKLVKPEQVANLVKLPAHRSIVCRQPGAGCKTLGSNASQMVEQFDKARAAALSKILLLATEDFNKAEKLDLLIKAASIQGFNLADKSRTQSNKSHTYTKIEITSLKEFCIIIRTLGIKGLRAVTLTDLARHHPQEYQSYVEAKKAYTDALGASHVWIRTRNADNELEVFAAIQD